MKDCRNGKRKTADDLMFCSDCGRRMKQQMKVASP